MNRISGIVVIIFSIHFLGIFRIAILERDIRFEARNDFGNAFGAYILGFSICLWLDTLYWSATWRNIGISGPVRNSVLSGTSLLVVYAIGLGVPFLISAIFISRSLKFIKKIKNHMLIIEKAMGVLLLIVGVLLLTGGFSKVSFFLLELMPFLGNIG